MQKVSRGILVTVYSCLFIWAQGATAAISENAIGMTGLKMAEYVLAVEGNFISLRAREASLKTILEELSQKMSILVEGDIPQEETVSTAFAQLPLAEALQHLSPNYGYQIKNENGEHKISTIFVLPQPKGFVRPQPTPQDTQRKESTTSVVAGTTETVIILPRESAKPSEKGKGAQPAPFGFSFDPSAFRQ